MKRLHNIKLFMVMSFVFCAGNAVAMDADMAEQALLHAARLGYLENVQNLIAAGANVNWRDNLGQTPLMWTALLNRLHIVQDLIEAGADVNATKYGDGNTALMFALWGGNLAMIQALIAAGADVNISNNRSETALMLAVEEKNLEIVNMIINADGFDLDQLEPIIDRLIAKENKTPVEQQILEALQGRSFSIGLK